MGEMEAFRGKLKAITGGVEEEEENMKDSTIFSELKHYCIQLLDVLQNPNKIPSSTFSQLLHLLQGSPPDSLQPFFDYTLFPLLLLLDAAVNCRSSQNANSENELLSFHALEKPHNVSDAVAEATLLCLEELLKKCRLGSVDQMVVILKKLTHGALLSPSEASEEFREGVIRCFKGLLLNLHSCSDESCPCKQIGGCPTLLGRKDVQFSCAQVSKYDLVPEQCLLAFLQSEPASAIVGHWLSLLLKAADVEATRGHRGSSKLRVEAFIALRVLVAKVGSADALAFYLPGVVSQIGKVLHVSKSMISGAAGSTEALDHAIRGFAEYLIIVLEDNVNISSLGIIVNDGCGLSSREEKSYASLLEELRHLPVKNQGEEEITAKDLTKSVEGGITVPGFREKAHGDSDRKIGSLRVKRTREWIANTSAHVDKLLSATFPHLCVHPTKRVRQGLLATVQAFLSKCSYTLKESRLMLLECLCVLVCDDSEEVSSDAQAFFRHMFSSSVKHQLESDVAKVFSRLVEKLPQVVLGSEESLALSHVRKLLAVTYFSGPQLVADYLLHSPVTAAQFLDVFSLCLSQNSVFSGSLDKLVLARPSSSGFMRSIAELKAITDDSVPLDVQNRKMLYMPENEQTEYELPHLPPWFVNVGSQNLYPALAGILRLFARSLFADSQIEGSLSVIIDIPLGHLHKLISEIRMKEYHKESWQSWYKRTGSGQLVRQASTAACILNEMIFGLSDEAMTTFRIMFEKSSLGWQDTESFHADGNGISREFVCDAQEEYVWNIDRDSGARTHLIDCVGSILHEYLSSEIWDLPLGDRASLRQLDEEDGDVIIEGIGIFNICLGKEFSSSGFLHSSLFMLLENVICSNFQIRRACDAVLRVISAIHDCASVGHLVLANSDYVIDSICQQLRHLDLNPHVPNILAAMLSYVGVADKVLPLLEEPMGAVSMELEILGRHQHPNLTTSFLKAVAEITKASKHEACTLPNKAESFWKDVNFNILNSEKRTGKLSTSTSYVDNTKDIDYMELETESRPNGANTQMEEWESILFKLTDSRRYRRIVGSIAGSCLKAATPLIASADQAACLIALDVIEDGIIALAKVEEAYKHEIKTKEAIQEFFSSCSFHILRDTLDAAEDETGENRLLPAMNKIWPFLVCCVRNKNPVTIRRCSHAISTVVQICGGEFFSRRFRADGIHFWKLLSTSPFQKKPFSREERTPFQLPYRSISTSSEDPPAEISSLKVQAELLNMISDLARNKRSSSALEAVFKKVSGLVVGIACSGVKGLLDASVNALVGLAYVDPDLIWLLLSDVYYSRKRDLPSPPTSEFPDISEIMPPPSSSKEYLYVLYGGQSYGFDIDFTSVETVFKKLHTQVFTRQIYF
ncbi:unnamed protein product [Fraxinus pennsylvanica]|uniref:TTI1 N-terminal TPR domain-containing protein n=1 Tax=Fraxinus pennsylvanica TaxID=56036 RepID=A0AAD2DLP3_9LAMI|nr:unnamed protein product [Fraxinus pennsylvanica]